MIIQWLPLLLMASYGCWAYQSPCTEDCEECVYGPKIAFCSQCKPGYRPDYPYGNGCEPCSEGCLRCQHGAPEHVRCITCKKGYRLTSQGKCGCPAGCGSCFASKGDVACKSCHKGFTGVIHVEGLKCHRCPSHCDVCKDDHHGPSCLVCTPGYQLESSGLCTGNGVISKMKCRLRNCESCHFDTTGATTVVTCNRCEKGYVREHYIGICTAKSIVEWTWPEPWEYNQVDRFDQHMKYLARRTYYSDF